MKRHFEEAEEELKNKILSMGSLVEEMIHSVIQGLMERKKDPLELVVSNENKVNELHIEIDDRCLKLIALHQPTATDLRFIMAAIKINSDLERIGDQAVNISENTRFLLEQPMLEKKLLDIPRMADLAKEMLKDALDAFVRKDVNLAREVIARDDAEDKMKS